MTQHEQRARKIGAICPDLDCCDKGFRVDPGPRDGEPMQVQCEHCYTNPRSVFNVRNTLATVEREALERAKAAVLAAEIDWSDFTRGPREQMASVIYALIGAKEGG